MVRTRPAIRLIVAFVARVRLAAWLIAVMLAALLIGALPLLIAGCCAPVGATGLGTVWFINDFAQYESAMRQGQQSTSWLIHDAFTSEAHAPALMFPLYVAIGKLASATQVSTLALERSLEVVARVALVLAVWRFAHAFAANASAARWALALTLFGSGFEIVGGAVGGYSGNWSYETNGFGLLFAAPHVPLAMAATLLLATLGLLPQSATRATTVALSAGLGAAIALLHPFHLPVLLVALLLAGAVYWRTERGFANLATALAACAGALPVLFSTVLTFGFDPFWLQTYTSQNQLPSPAPHELLVDLGPSLLLALGGAWFMRGRVAPFGLLVWLLLAASAMYLPVPYQRRLGFGIQPALAILAANTLVAWAASLTRERAAALRLSVVATAALGTVLILGGMVASAFGNMPLPVYRSTVDLDAAAAWLNQTVQDGDVILADWQVSNYLAPRTPARVFGGHPVATLRADEKRFLIASVFVHPGAPAVARSFGANWLVYGPAEVNLQAPPSPAFQSGDVRVYRLDGAE